MFGSQPALDPSAAIRASPNEPRHSNVIIGSEYLLLVFHNKDICLKRTSLVRGNLFVRKTVSAVKNPEQSQPSLQC